ncbi:hypothetical protein AN901_204506 [Pseudomonas syringae pv. theae]|nr:hypothetical protein AN901_204506 [Pseudomonas syringae pv. theae]
MPQLLHISMTDSCVIPDWVSTTSECSNEPTGISQDCALHDAPHSLP